MFKHSVITEQGIPDFTLNFLCMTYITMVVLSIVLFDQILNFKFFGISIELSGAVVPYVFLYPISFIVLRIYGLRYVNNMVASMIIVSLLFALISTVVSAYSTNKTGIHDILLNSSKMYLAGFIGMPAGIYTSFLVLKWLSKVNITFNVLSLTIATIIGEIINTIVVFPVGFHGEYSSREIFRSIIIDAMIFKIIIGAILAVIAIITIKILIKIKMN